jgi:demethylmenaquinone methyltransferase/2-methoxy-6-polyprenyl-1,4-benzoquinol methylase
VEPLTEQMTYYRQRAGEYDEWWLRQGQYVLEPDAERRWFADVAQVELALDEFAPTGDVLEYAAGTGIWTRRLAYHARHVTAVDSSLETIALNRSRLPAGASVDFLQADIFSWEPPRAAFDVVFFGYWLSHVPADRLVWFWEQVASALRPGGRVFLVDSYSPTRLDGDVQQRRLNDGRGFQVVKRYWQPSELADFGASAGWQLDVDVTENRCILYARGARSAS